MSTYLVHHGYCATAEAFARNTGQAFEEELTSIKNRQSIKFECFIILNTVNFHYKKEDSVKNPNIAIKMIAL